MPSGLTGRAASLANLKSPPPGRLRGSRDRVTHDLKRAIIDAAVAFGSDGKGTGGLSGYLFWLAGSHPKAYAGLLGKMLPFEVHSSSRGIAVGTVNVVSVPVDRYLSREDLARIQPLTIEAEAESEPEHEIESVPELDHAGDIEPAEPEIEPEDLVETSTQILRSLKRIR